MTNPRNFFSLAATFLAVMLVFSSCQKDNIDIQDGLGNEQNDITGNNGGILALVNGGGTTDSLDCFTLQYPITVLFPDGTSQEVNDDDALETAVDFWYDNNADTDTDVTLQFPITVNLADGTTQTIDSEEALDQLLVDCYGEWDDDEWDDDCEEGEYEEFADCFTLVYPIEVTTAAGVSTINNDEELEALWDTLNEDEDFAITFPISVILEEDGTTVTINTEDELDELLYECYDGDWDDDEDFSDCFTIVYPINVTLADGSVVTANNDDELDDLFENLDDEDFEISFPVSVVLEEDGTTVTINTEDELDELLDECYGDEWDDDEDFSDCFTVVYPINLTLADGSVATVNNDDELYGVFENSADEDAILFNYPVDVVLTADGSTVTVNNDDEIDEILDACE